MLIALVLVLPPPAVVEVAVMPPMAVSNPITDVCCTPLPAMLTVAPVP